MLAWTLALVSLVTLSATGDAQTSSVDRFRYQPEKIEPGTVYHYRKSNQDGTHASRIALYVESKDKIAAFKYRRPAMSASYVTATMDWSTFSPRRLVSHKKFFNAPDRLQGSMEYIPERDAIELSFDALDGDLTVTVRHLPYHIWDFDFASLNFAMRHLIDPEGDLTIGVTDPDHSGETPEFKYKGEVAIRFVGEEMRHEELCRKYAIDGAGLEHRGGHFWVSKQHEHVVEFEIDQPDEPGFDDVRIVLEKVEQMDQEAWDTFVKDQFFKRRSGS